MTSLSRASILDSELGQLDCELYSERPRQYYGGAGWSNWPFKVVSAGQRKIARQEYQSTYHRVSQLISFKDRSFNCHFRPLPPSRKPSRISRHTGNHPRRPVVGSQFYRTPLFSKFCPLPCRFLAMGKSVRNRR
jgi:hypothetical protein